MNLGLALKKYRKEKNITQKEIAYDLGITREYYCRLENGISLPSIAVFEKICRTTKIDVHRVMQMKGRMEEKPNGQVMCETCFMLNKSDKNHLHKLMLKMVR